MDQRRITKRYFAVLVPAMAVFLGTSLGIAWLDDNMSLPVEVLVVLAVVPIAALLSIFWIHWRYMRDLDEYLRQIQVKALLFGAAIALGVGTGWGYLEQYADLPALAVFWLNPLFWVAYAIGVVAFSLRDGADLR